ncbi:MAG: nucleotide exchange factor GrpE [Desulfosalsimonadaceae bacterium]
MDHDSGNHEDNEIEFGIHLDDLSESPDSAETKPAAFSEEDAEPLTEEQEMELARKEGQGESEPLGLEIKNIQKQLEELSQSFDTKLKYDAHKNKVIDELHNSLQQYRDGLLKKYLQRIFTDVIKIVDDVRKLSSYYHEQPASEENSAKLLQYLEDIAYDLEDIFAWEGVVSFTTDSGDLDPARQRVVSKVETDDPAKDKMIAQRLRPGYEWEGKVIRPEIVAIYIYNEQAASENKEI